MFITGASIILTENCNLRCSYCYENTSRDCGKVMTADVARATVDFLISQTKQSTKKEVFLNFFGGEPLINMEVLNSTFDYAVEKCREEKLALSCMITTNATIFTDEYEEFLKKFFNSDAKCVIQLSIDGIPKIQDGQRFLVNGNGSSALVEETVKRYFYFFDSNNIDWQQKLKVHSCVSPDSVNYLYDNYRYFRSLGFNGVWCLPIQEADWTDEHAETFRTHLQRIADEIFAECVEKNTLVYYNAYSSLKKVLDFHPALPCGAGVTNAGVSSDGLLYPCHKYMFGDRDCTFGDVFNGITAPEKRQKFLEYGTKNLMGDKMCVEACGNKNCYRCIAMNEEHNGDMLVGFPKYCKMSRVEEEIRQSLRKRLIEAGLIEDKGTSCSSESCSTDNSIETLKPIFEVLDEHLNSIKEASLTSMSTSDRIERKIDGLFELMSGVLVALEMINSKIKE